MSIQRTAAQVTAILAAYCVILGGAVIAALVYLHAG